MFIKLWRDESGIILPYVTVMMLVFIGMGALALDGGRYMSLQTQMQSVADGLALAGARELNQHAGARDRATSAINTLVSNGLNGMGYSGTITHAGPVFYSALPDATAGFGGTPATSDFDAKFVAVTVNPVTVPTIMPIGVNNFSTGARAIAGFTAKTPCDFPPVFICNPYETGGMGDAAATSALRTALSDPTVTRKMIRMDRSQTSPGHFGYLVPEGASGTCKGANSASCLKDYIAKTHPRSCYSSNSVSLNTGAMNSVNDAFNVRFDMYSGNLKYSADYAPAVNVRKGFLPPKAGGGKDPWCSADVPPAPSPYYTLPIVTTTGTTTKGSPNITAIPSTANLISGNPMLANPLNGLSNTATISSIINGTSVSVTGGSANKDGTGVALTSKGITGGLPLDSNMYADPTAIFGNGDWNCADYWAINHTAAAPAGCTKTNPTISRYEVYRYEIANNLVNDWSAGPDGTHPNNAAANKSSESGAPYCAGVGNGVDPSMGTDPATNLPYHDRRVIHAAIINCTAQAIGNGANADNVPVADFGKFFMTQPVGVNDPKVDPNSLYGEMAGLVSSLELRILNQVQLYR